MPDAPGKHPAETELHEYLDGELTGRRSSEVQMHLAECVECTDRIIQMRRLFVLLEQLPEETEDSDLAPPVLQSLRRRRRSPEGIGRTAIAQGLAALVIVLLLGSDVPAWLSRLSASLPDSGSVDWLSLAGRQAAALGDAARSALSAPAASLLEFMDQLATWPLATGAALALAAVAIAAWMAANTLLLRAGRRTLPADSP